MYTEQYFNEIRNVINQNRLNQVLNNKSILVTGANGLIGAATIDFLIYLNEYEEANISIYAAGRNKGKIEKRFCTYVDKDYFVYVPYDANTSLDFQENVDFIIHAASNAHPGAYGREPVETMISNFYGTYNLLKYIKEQNAGRLLLISSSEVYGKNEKKKLFLENNYGYVDILNYRACYPSSKRAAETLCASFIKEYSTDCVTIRPGHVYGPFVTDEDTRASSEFIKRAARQEDIVMKSAGTQLRSYCHIFDCVSALLAVLIKGICGEAYNISNKDSVVTIREFAEALAAYSGRKILFENPNLNEKGSYNLMDCSALNSDKLESLGWRGCYNLENGIKQTLETLIEEK